MSTYAASGQPYVDLRKRPHNEQVPGYKKRTDSIYAEGTYENTESRKEAGQIATLSARR